MQLSKIMYAMSGLNICGLRLAIKSMSDFRAYLSEILRRYDELVGKGLSAKCPVTFLIQELGVLPHERVQLPLRVMEEGGISLGELTTIAMVTQIVKPKMAFEIGTYNGCTTSIILMNTFPETLVYSMDLPLESKSGADMIHLDSALVSRRNLAAYVYEYRLEDRFRQVLCDSMRFDPEPYRNTVEMGFIDGGHSYECVKNDTEKMAIMMAPRGLVFWHDYGGKGEFGPLSDYLERLSKMIKMYRVAGTTLAWTTAEELRKIR